ncbi:hypothetical protein DACRYDRAFT_109822 [Dacryopinax primogenitus]|uniref:F-box domain-containing protein n=1 Tax=Dacryopinax primogenitus (strain DJM 731) TaxID=1858805 RepID=M5G1K3_DACPD|nr:uncharacterized protein DACRYDRAFT_109822 [Dacryopinax primogenitus]EJT99716.1 hypothetical protein DACRYDRAFT_109822 [Dacryopinax primogenitus]
MATPATILLPFDVWHNIVLLIEDQADLIQLCLINSNIGAIATKCLYRAVNLSSLLNIVHFYRAVVKHPFLASQTVALSLRLGNHDFQGKVSEYDTCSPDQVSQAARPSAYLRLMFRLIHVLVGLKTLHLATPHSFSQPRIPISFSVNLGRIKRPLSSFTFHAHGQPSVLPILLTQTSLEELCLHGMENVLEELRILPPNCLPRLRFLESDVSMASVLARDRPIQAFSIVGSLTSVEPARLSSCLDHLQMSTGPIQRIDLSLKKTDCNIFSDISTALPDIVALCLDIWLPLVSLI